MSDSATLDVGAWAMTSHPQTKGRNLSQMFAEFVDDREERDHAGRNEYS
jgi:hypothetical protein